MQTCDARQLTAFSVIVTTHNRAGVAARTLQSVEAAVEFNAGGIGA
jgi:hypothetical protein